MVDGDTASGLSKTLLGVGAFLILLSLTVLEWFRSGPGFFANAGSNTSFHEMHNAIVVSQHQTADIASHVSYGASAAYFSWLGWVLFLAAVAFGVLALTSVGASFWPVKWLSGIACVAGMGLTFLALDFFTVEGNPPKVAKPPSYAEYLSHSGPAAWVAIVGYLLIMTSSFLARRSR